MIANDKVFLLAYTEVGEDGVEDVVGGDGAGDGAEVVGHLAEVFGQEVGGKPFGKSGEGFVRASYCYSTSHIREALSRIEEFLKEIK